MRTAISTACLYPAQTENALETLLKAGFKTFEIFLNTESEVMPSYLLGLKAMLNNNGASYYIDSMFSDKFCNM